MARKYGRVDRNQNEIVEALRRIGCSVAVTSGVGVGFPDLVVGYRGANYLIEIKDGSKPPSEQKLTPDQQDFKALWRGQYAVVNTPEKAIDYILSKS